jgi:hypothetical protein
MQRAEFRTALWAALNQPVWVGPLLTKRRCLLMPALAAFAFLVIATLALHFWPREEPLKLACDRVQQGMTPAEVDAIFGRPPDNEKRHDTGVMGEFWRAEGEVDPDRRTTRGWKGADGALAVVGFRHDRAVGAYWIGPPVKTLAKLRRWFPFLNFK